MPALTGKFFRLQELSETDKREFWALQDVSFEVKQGEAVGIIGANGAGKSTILKILSRIMKPTKGSMSISGRLSAVIEVSAGFHHDLTGRENIYLNGTVLGMRKREIDSKLDQIIDFSGIEEFIDTPVKRYSSGMNARLGFAIAAHVDPDILIVDEVLSVGDYAFQQKCMARMNEIVRQGATALFVSHNLFSVAEFCPRCLLLDRGKIVHNVPTEDVISRYFSRLRATEDDGPSTKQVSISKISVRGEHGESIRFRSGEKVWIDIEITAREQCQKLSVSLSLSDPKELVVLDTSTERLGNGSFNLEAGETCRCTFEVTLNLVGGTYIVSALIYRYDIGMAFDRWLHAVTFFVSYDQDVRGVANCFPRMTGREIVAAGEVNTLA
ncbi:MAG: ABC transporter ATP-binding protein [Terriglobales bacterium]